MDCCHWYNQQVGCQLWTCLFIIHEELGYHKICARWVSEQLTDEHKWAHMETCLHSCSNIVKECLFLQLLVTLNETWVHQYESASKCQKHGMETHVITQNQEIQKCAFCQQSDVDAVLGHQWAHPQAHTVSSAQYCALLVEEFKPAVFSKCRGMLSNGIVLHRDNALNPIWQQWPLKWLKNWNLSFSPTQHTVQISPHLITTFLDCLDMCYVNAYFANNEEVKDTVYMASCATKSILCIWQQETWLKWCVEKLGDFVKKLQYSCF
jgi:hypothetical protein